MPEIARPTISIVDDCATAQIRLPSSKTKNKDKNVHYRLLDIAPQVPYNRNQPALVLKYMYNLPVSGWRAALLVECQSIRYARIRTSAELT